MNQFEYARSISKLVLQQDLKNNQVLNRSTIQNAVDLACDRMQIPVSPEERKLIVRELQAQFQIVIGRETEMRGEDANWEDWLIDRRAEIEWSYWTRYRSHLDKKSFSDTVLGRLDESTDRVLNLIGDPKGKPRWDRRGLVVGLVQSGKTAHYIGLMNKAIDSGYKVVVVLTGFNENLRVQTQIRAEEGLLGYSLVEDPNNPPDLISKRCGVGMEMPLDHHVDSVTTRRTDFRAAMAKALGVHSGGNPILFVVKKNATVLKHLLSYFKNMWSTLDSEGIPYISSNPLLVIDDESDVGSVDTNSGAIDEYGDVDEDHDPTKINKQIRKLIAMFDQSSYVGYTATPFANVLIHDKAAAGQDPEDDLLIGADLFPESFIVSLPTPDNHIGPSVIFGSVVDEIPALPIIRTITDVPEKEPSWMPGIHRTTHEPLVDGRDELPESLERAIMSFILVIAARNLRSDRNKHNSMLIHVTRFVDVQGRVYDQVVSVLSDFRNRLRQNMATSRLLEDLRALWEDGIKDSSDRIMEASFLDTAQRIKKMRGEKFDGDVHSWEEISTELRAAVESIEIRKIHGNSGEDLDYSNYPNGLNVIAIGGDKLSRGLTLEGLSVSYFLRSSRMYDTLMQMGRWFGYRPRYLDLCRLYTTERLSRWFGKIAEATDELRAEFDRMAAIPKCTPKQFGLRVRSHPEMLVTSAVKMKYGIPIQVTFQGAIVETIDFSRKSPDIQNNWYTAKRLISELGRYSRVPAEQSPVKYEWEGVDPSLVTVFLQDYKQHVSARKVIPKLLKEYIEAENKERRLKSWRVLIATGDGEDKFRVGDIHGQRVSRAWYYNDETISLDQLKRDNHYRIRRLVSPNHETAGIRSGTPQYKEALRRTLKDWQRRIEAGETDSEKPTIPSGPYIREVRDASEGLLILYPLSSLHEKSEEIQPYPILGFAISFPSVDGASKVSYIAGTVYQEQEELF